MPAFYNFDFEDMGTKDLPAMINFVTQLTGQEKVSYIGHSEGTTQMFIGSSMLPDYFASKINLFIAYAPVARLDNTMSNLLKYVAWYVDEIEDLAINYAGMYNFFSPDDIGDSQLKFC